MAKKKNGVGEGNPNREAVAKAIEELGPKADIAMMAEYIKSNFNLDIENKVIGIHRHHILRGKQKKTASAGAARKSARSTSGGDVSMDEIRLIKDLVNRHGAPRVRDLIELLS